MNRESALGGFFTLLTKKVNVSEEDPNYFVLEEMMKDLPDAEVYNFYKFFSSSSRFFNDAGFTNIFSVEKALVEYKREIASKLWRQYGLEEKAATLSDKLAAVFYSLREFPVARIVTILDNRDLSKFKNTADKSPLFDTEETEIIFGIGFYRLYEKNVHEGFTILKDLVTDQYKTLYTGKFFSPNSDTHRLGNAGGGGESVSPEVISIFSNSIKRIK